jgi:hypothetical protein
VTIVTVIAGRAQTRHGASAGSKRVAGRLASAIRDFINASDIGVRAERDFGTPIIAAKPLEKQWFPVHSGNGNSSQSKLLVETPIS